MKKINMEIITKVKWKDKEVPVADLLKELLEQNANQNEKIKECYCNRTDCSSRIKDSKKYDSLQQRIDKAIEYIKSYNLPEDLGSLSECPVSVNELKELLDILRGENNEGE